MKKTIIYLTLLFSIIICFNSTSQNQIWVKSNAVWHYDYSTTFGGGFIKIEYVKDTILDSKTSKMFTSKIYHFIEDQSNIIQLLDSSYIDTNYTWNNNDTVFYWNQNHFEILYDFSKTAGDSWIIGTGADTVGGCSETSTAQITNDSTINLNGTNYTSFDLFSADSCYLKLRGKYNSRFGAFSETYDINNFIFPLHTYCGDNILTDYTMFKFKCFQDDSLYYNPSGEDCEYYLTHLGVNKISKPEFNLYPNPSDGMFTIESITENFDVIIYNSLGLICEKHSVSGNIKSFQLDLEKGIYFVELVNNNEINGVVSKLILK